MFEGLPGSVHPRRSDPSSLSRRRSAIVAGTLLAALAAAPVSAAVPYREPLVDGGSEVVPCAGFDALFTRSFTGTVTVFFDNAGQPIRVLIVAHMDGSLQNLTTQWVLPLRGDLTVMIDLVDWTTAFTGNVLIGTRAGDGAILRDIGRIVFDATDDIVLFAGPHDLISTGPDALCAAVA